MSLFLFMEENSIMKKFKNLASAITALVISILILTPHTFAVPVENVNDCLTGADENDCQITSDELETLIKVENVIWKSFINKNVYAEDSAYVTLKWNSHKVQLFVKTQEAYKKAVAFIKSDIIDKNLVDVILSPELDYKTCDGGSGSADEVNSIIANEYFAIKDFLTEKKIVSDMYIISETDSQNTDISRTLIEVYVKDKNSEDALQTFMKENYFWQDMVKISIVSNFTEKNENVVYFKDCIV